jgi:CRP-like cAMP-binding protein
MDRESVARDALLAPKVRLLAACNLFADVSAGGIDQLAGAATEVTVRAGQSIVREGEPADAFYVVADGRLSVTARGEADTVETLNDLSAGDYFGEIGLIEQIPRTATVTPTTKTVLLRIDGPAFLEALTQSAPSPALLDGASLRLRRTHPSKGLTQSGLSSSS